MVSLMPRVSAQRALNELVGVRNAIDEQLGTNVLFEGAEANYLAWAHSAATSLRTVLRPSSLENLLFTPAFARVQQLSARDSPVGTAAVIYALEDSSRRLRDAIAGLENLQVDWAHSLAVVLDTNVLLTHYPRLASIPWTELSHRGGPKKVRLGVPMVVVEELDGLKRSHNKMPGPEGKDELARDLARRALRQLAGFFDGGHHTFQFEDNNLRVVLIADPLEHVRLAEADSEILDQALSLVPFADEVAVATADTAMRFRAQQLGLTAFAVPKPTPQMSVSSPHPDAMG